ncbi:hypothetical protein D3C80_2000310 [compost metagenome]
MDVMGEALAIDRKAILALASEAEVTPASAAAIIDRICAAASQFTSMAERMYPQMITQDTLQTVQGRIDENSALLQSMS